MPRSRSLRAAWALALLYLCEPVGGECRFSLELRRAPARALPEPDHLRETVLGMGKAQAKHHTFGVLRVDVRHRVSVSRDADRSGDAGEFDGHEFGDGSCTLFMYGPDADALFAAVEPILRASPLADGAYAVKRYGDVGEVNVREVPVHF